MLGAGWSLPEIGVSLRPEIDSDRSFLERLFRETRAAALAPLGWTASAEAAFLADQFDIQRRSYAQTYPTAERLIVERQGHPVGRLHIERRDGDLHLIDITITASERGRGVGGALISALQADVSAGKAERVTLSVDLDNVGARRLYARLGFTESPPRSRYGEMSIEMTWRPGVS